VYKYFPGFSDTGEVSGAGEVFRYTSPAPEKYFLHTFPGRRSVYIHLSGAGEAGEAFIYTQAAN